MTREEAIKILDVNNTSAKELERIKNYKGFNGREAIFYGFERCLFNGSRRPPGTGGAAVDFGDGEVAG